ncbi:NADP oxidoreductase [Micromonospora sp. WMMD980]|uniref:NADPH-dependent F420 reductase n=1 Tax=Micromonospora sp. WMMD980 TaxID=3016088 RepID=UPI0024173D5E|nr:NADP oxidoreductase [Micromonospora sp. WMMD980]MDG4804482.1 NADP oxidoreductase [Micromonospora sp. WMMD980]
MRAGIVPGGPRGGMQRAGPRLVDLVQVRQDQVVLAATGADLVVNATNGDGSLPALDAAGAENLAGKILLDIANPLDFSQGFPPILSVLNDDSLGERIQRAFPRTRVVKALNTLTADLMTHPRQLADGDHSVFVSGDDAEAKGVVTELLASFGHTDVIDLGDITTARGTEMLLPIWLRLYGRLGTALFNVKVVR